MARIMRKHLTLLFGACLATACLAAPVRSNQTISFGDCPTDVRWPGLKCGSLVVPMDWDNPTNGKTITVGVTKIAARNPSKRIGPLLYQPGGPGVLVSNSLRGIVKHAEPIQDEILDSFDLIGIDTRGNGLSTPITCDRDLWNARERFFASSPKSYDALVKHNQAIRQSCIDMTGSDLIDYMDGISIVHDYEAVRKALGGEKYTWLGQSYGTLLGSQYAELYAENLRGMILDGSISNSQPETAQIVQAGESNEGTLDFFFSWCEDDTAGICPASLKKANKPLPEIWDDMIERAEKSPIPGKQCGSTLDCAHNTAKPGDIRQGGQQLLYSQNYTFPILAEAFEQAAFQNDASIFLNVTPHVGAHLDTYTASGWYSENAIACQDFAHNSSATEMFWWDQIGKNDMSHLGGVSTAGFFVHECVGWPQPKRNPPHTISIPETLEPKILMVTNFHDPATPSAWSVQLQQEIGEDRAVLVERKKAGHTAYFIPGASDGPTVAAMNHYLLTLEVPAQRTIYDN